MRVLSIFWLSFLVSVLAISVAYAAQPHADSAAQPPISSREDYNVIRDLALQIYKRYPPEEYFYVGIGRSPTPIMSFFQMLGVDHANLPLSSMGRAAKTVPPEELSATLSPHFDRFLPSTETLHGRKILIVDFSVSGRSLISARDQINRYLSRAGRAPVQTLGLVTEGERLFSLQHVVSLLQGEKIDTLEIPYGKIGHAFIYSEFEDFAEYPPFELTQGKGAAPPTEWGKKSEYEVLGKVLRGYAAEDPVVQNLVKARGANCSWLYDGLLGSTTESGQR